VGVLAVLGALAGLARAVREIAGRSPSPAVAVRVTAADSLLLDVLTAGANLAPGSPRRAMLEADARRFQATYTAHPAAILLHVVPGTLFMLLAPFQLVAGIRSRYTRWHRWSGRILLLSGALIGSSALFFAWLAPHAGWPETLIITIVGGLFLVSGAMAWAAIRRRDVARHREWMIRFLALGLAISTVRLVSSPIVLLLPTITFESGFVLALVLGWTITFACAEWWIRRGRESPSPLPPSHSGRSRTSVHPSPSRDR
jgi:uncharacterized membrane protein